jgi:hypothetical protein
LAKVAKLKEGSLLPKQSLPIFLFSHDAKSMLTRKRRRGVKPSAPVVLRSIITMTGLFYFFRKIKNIPSITPELIDNAFVSHPKIKAFPNVISAVIQMGITRGKPIDV